MTASKLERQCRLCGTPLKYTFVNLGVSPLANSFLLEEELHRMEPFYPLRVYVCEECYLVQLPAACPPEQIFGEYSYFSSYSDSWLKHAEAYAEHVTERFELRRSSLVVEIGSNDGYLLQFFAKKGIQVLGVEPAGNVAKAAMAAGIPTVVQFFSPLTATELVREGKEADLLVGNNVLAHVPDLVDFVRGMKLLLGTSGVITMEFPHLMRLVERNEFDTIYHEHLSYFSFMAVERLFADNGLVVFDVEEIPTHGGSLRIYARHVDDTSKPVGERVRSLRDKEVETGLARLDYYLSFEERVRAVKRSLLQFLIEAKEERKRIVGYGAPAKGNTLLNYCGIGTDFIDYTVDRSPHKQGRFLPGSRIPILAPETIRETRPDYVLLLPWNLKEEIMEQMAFIFDWGGRFVVPIPEVRVYP